MISSLHGAALPADWMSGLPDSIPLAKISLPGSHDSGSLFEPIPGTAKCQILSIDAQLNAGVRFLDIRCRHVRDRFIIHHGPIDQKLGFDQVMTSVIGFLKSHPKECLVLSIKEEFTAIENTRSFEKTFDHYVAQDPAHWWLGGESPTLKQVRGKVILFRRFAAKSIPKGVDATSWKDNAAFTTGFLKVQDIYQAPNADEKWRGVQVMLEDAAKGSGDTLFVNFTSATGSVLGIPRIPSISEPINRKLASYLDANPKALHGILVMDFVTEELCQKVYQSNFRPIPR